MEGAEEFQGFKWCVESLHNGNADIFVTHMTDLISERLTLQLNWTLLCLDRDGQFVIKGEQQNPVVPLRKHRCPHESAFLLPWELLERISLEKTKGSVEQKAQRGTLKAHSHLFHQQNKVGVWGFD